MKRLILVLALGLVVFPSLGCNGSKWTIGIDIGYVECWRCHQVYSRRYARCPYCFPLRDPFFGSYCPPNCHEQHHHWYRR